MPSGKHQFENQPWIQCPKRRQCDNGTLLTDGPCLVNLYLYRNSIGVFGTHSQACSDRAVLTDTNPDTFDDMPIPHDKMKCDLPSAFFHHRSNRKCLVLDEQCGEKLLSTNQTEKFCTHRVFHCYIKLRQPKVCHWLTMNFKL